MENKMYRICEFDNEFTIQIGIKSIFSKKIIWYPVNEKGEKATGGALSYNGIDSFKSLKKAKKKIKLFRTEVKYYIID